MEEVFVHIYVMEYYSAIKNNEMLIIMLSDISQEQRDSTTFSHTYVEYKKC
jgi:hypothetical protein